MPASYRSLIAWQKAMTLVTEVYSATSRFPKEELFCLTSQIRRAAISIPSNIAEGNGSSTHQDRLRFLYQARGSVLEVQAQLEIASRLLYIESKKATVLIESANEVARIINGLLKGRTLSQSARGGDGTE